MPAEKPGDGPVLIVRFNDSVITEVVIEGRKRTDLAPPPSCRWPHADALADH
jgi:hypothetical protein